MKLQKVISGGQTGADMGGILGAKDAGIKTGGYAAKNFMTEDGPNPKLKEEYELTDSGFDYVGRTNLNAKNSDVTFWFGTTDSRGFFATLRSCRMTGKQMINNPTPKHMADYIRRSGVKVINIAGNRESHAPGIQKKVRELIKEALLKLKEDTNE